MALGQSDMTETDPRADSSVNLAWHQARLPWLRTEDVTGQNRALPANSHDQIFAALFMMPTPSVVLPASAENDTGPRTTTSEGHPAQHVHECLDLARFVGIDLAGLGLIPTACARRS